MWSISSTRRIFLSSIAALLSTFLFSQFPCVYEDDLSRHSLEQKIYFDFANAIDNDCCTSNVKSLFFRISLNNPLEQTVRVDIDNSYINWMLFRNPSDIDSCFHLYPPFITTSDSVDFVIKYGPEQGWLQLSTTVADTTEICQEAIILNCGDSIFDVNFNEIPVVDDLSCEYYERKRVGTWFKILGNDSIGRILVDRNNPSHFDFDLNLYNGNCNDLQCILYGERNIEYFFEKDSIYFLYAGVNSEIGGKNVPIEYNCFPVALNSYCSSPETLICGDTTKVFLGSILGNFDNYNRVQRQSYYKLNGTGEFIVLTPLNTISQSFTIYPDSCSSIPLSFDYPNTSFLENGKEYIIKLNTDNSYSNLDTAIFLTSCFSPTALTSCFQATELLVDSSHIGTLRYSEPTFIPNQCSYADSLRSKWFTIAGANKLVDVTTNQEFLVYRGSCDSLQCVSSYINQFNQFITLGEQYYLLLYEKHNAPANYHVDVRFSEVTPNAFDSIPQQLNCGDSIAFNWNQSFNQTPWCSDDELKTLYYSFNGNNQFVRFQSNFMTFVRDSFVS